ncbi:hypothetical protein BP00DRAFT_273366 [Aspergillus indologenus CBS 114.80]|uniref:Uncharacterized protein n=1 Tax=Aspergillus indologenus CBS 114.80 TaxID=1450541 RepID=A0A2V5HUH9_9EURO|nr:hypothetical protein BP00DRAFT_273366 [Aspergillus indologenus CBS 114.80]
MPPRFEQAIWADEAAVIGPGTVGSITFTAPGPDSQENKTGKKRGLTEFRAIGAARLLSNGAAVVVMISTECVVLANISAPVGLDDTVESVTRNSVDTFLQVCRRTVRTAAPRSHVIVDAITPEGRIWVFPERVSLIGRMLSDALPGIISSQVGYEVQSSESGWAKGQVFVDARINSPKVYVDDVEVIQVHFGPKDCTMSIIKPGWFPPIPPPASPPPPGAGLGPVTVGRRANPWHLLRLMP